MGGRSANLGSAADADRNRDSPRSGQRHPSLISVLANRLPPHRQARARHLGLVLALVTRLALLACIVWVAKLSAPMFERFGRTFSWRDVISMAGGLFLVYSGTREIHGHIEGHESRGGLRSASGLALLGSLPKWCCSTWCFRSTASLRRWGWRTSFG